MKDKLKKLPCYFQEVAGKAAKEAAARNLKIYLVGGLVRDLILGRPHYDLDFVVEGDAIALAQALAAGLGADFRRHHAFGTAAIFFKGYKIDFATARKEIYPKPGHLPRVIPASLRDDLFRRDFSINAMAISLNRGDYGRLVDFYNGRRDLEKKLVRALHDKSFIDDPTRILRAVRFEQRFSFNIEKHTLDLIKKAAAAQALKLVHPHRLRDELVLVLKEDSPLSSIKRLHGLNALSFTGKNIHFDKKIGDLFAGARRAIEYYRNKFKKLRKIDGWIIYLAALTVNMSRQETGAFISDFNFNKGEKIRLLSAKDAPCVLKRLRQDTRPHALCGILNEFSFETILFFYACSRTLKIKEKIDLFFSKLVHIRLRIRGEDLKNMGLSPRELYGKALAKVLEEKIDGKLKNKKDEIAAARLFFKNLHTSC